MGGWVALLSFGMGKDRMDGVGKAFMVGKLKVRNDHLDRFILFYSGFCYGQWIWIFDIVV